MIGLEHKIHSSYIVLGVAPVPLGGKISEFDMVLKTEGYLCCGIRDLSCYELKASSLGFMIEEDTGACEHIVALPVVLCDPVSVELGNSVGRSGIEGRCLLLGDLLDLTEHLGCGSLIESGGRIDDPYCLEHIRNTDGIDISRSQGRIPGSCYERLGCEVIYLIGERDLHGGHQGYGVSHIGIDKMYLILQMLNIAVIDISLSSPDTVYLITLLQKEFCEVRSVLSRDTGDECSFHDR